jgi:hypothetical protein
MTTHADIVIPYNMTLQDWADSFVLAMAHMLPLPQLDGDSDFERWAAQIGEEPILEPFRIPQPPNVVEWRAWALQTINSLSTIGAS